MWNPAATEIFGYPTSEALEMNVEALVPEHLRERHRTGLSRYRETGHGRYVDSRELLELPAVRKDGTEISVEMSLSPLEPADGSGLEGRFVLAIVRDMTERKRAEEALRQSEARFHALIENALDIVMVTDADGAIRYMSPSVERVLGYRPDEMIGTNTAEYVHPDDLEEAINELGEAVSRPGVHPVAVETRVRHKDGSWRHLEGIANNLLEDPVVGGMVFNHRDVTDRVRAEAELRGEVGPQHRHERYVTHARRGHARHLRGTHRAIPRTHEHVYVRHVSAAANKRLPDPHAFSLLRSIAATCG